MLIKELFAKQLVEADKDSKVKRIIGYRVVGTDIFIPVKDFEQDGRYYELRGHEFEPVWDDEQDVTEGKVSGYKMYKNPDGTWYVEDENEDVVLRNASQGEAEHAVWAGNKKLKQGVEEGSSPFGNKTAGPFSSEERAKREASRISKELGVKRYVEKTSDGKYIVVKKQGVEEAGPFSYGKNPRKGSVADLAAKKRREQEKGKQPIEPKDQQVGVAKVTKGVVEGRFIKGPGGVPLDRSGKPIPPKAPKVTPPKVAKLTLDDVWRKVEDVVGQIVPDGDPIDWLVPWFNKRGVYEFEIGDMLEKAAKKHGYKDIYDYYDEVKSEYDKNI